MKCRSDADHIVEPFIKYILIALNAISFLINIGYIIGGSWLLYYRNQQQDNFQSVFNLATDLGGYLIAIGVIGLVFSLIAIAGTIRENVFILRMYSIILMAILILNIVIGVVFLIYADKITDLITSKLQTEYIQNYFEDSEIRTIFDALQSDYTCCGIQSYQDWNSNIYFNTNSSTALSGLVPTSCCVDYQLNSNYINTFCSGNVLLDSTLIYKINSGGCSRTIINLAEYGIKILCGIIIFITIFLVVTIVLTMYLIILIRKEMALHNSQKKYSELNEEEGDLDFLN